MSNRISRLILQGAIVVGFASLALWACTPVATKPPTSSAATTTSPDSSTAVSTKGQVKVAIQLPADTRQVQSVLDDLGSVVLTVSSPNWSPALTATISKADLADNIETKTFVDVPEGAATVKAVAKNTAGADMATDTAEITIAAGSTTYVSMKLTLVSNAGIVSATITIEIAEPGSVVPPGTIDDKQRTAQYIGTATCVLCHPGIGDVYKRAAHYHNGGTDRHAARPSCTKCHAMGGAEAAAVYDSPPAPFDILNAFSAPVTAPRDTDLNKPWMHQGCEACHGPGSKHVVASYEDRFKTITRVPSAAATCAKCHSGVAYGWDFVTGKPATESAMSATGLTTGQPALRVDITNFPNGVTEDWYMAGGTHNRPRMGLPGGMMNQIGAYTTGPITFSNAHNTIKNGCVGCHMAGLGPDKHSFMVTRDATASSALTSCQKCHGNGFSQATIDNYRAQTKLAVARLRDALVAYRNLFCKEVILSTRKSTESADIGHYNLSNNPSIWDDSDDYVKTATSSVATMNFTDKANWTDGNTHWSARQKIYNRSYWNYRFLGADVSNGVHAPTYSQKVLRDTYNELVTEMGLQVPTSTSSYSLMSLPR